MAQEIYWRMDRGEAGKCWKTKGMDERLIQTVRDAIHEDRRLTIREIAMINGCSKSSVHRIFHENLNMCRVCASGFRFCWVVKERKRAFDFQPISFDSMQSIRTFWAKHGSISMIRKKKDDYVCEELLTPPPKKAKGANPWENILIVLIERQGVHLCHAVPLGQTVNSAYYSKICVMFCSSWWLR